MNERSDLPPTECHIKPGPQPGPGLLPIEPIRYVPVATTGIRAPALAVVPEEFRRLSGDVVAGEVTS